MRIAFLLVALGWCAWGQSPQTDMEASIAKQRASVERQLESVQKQSVAVQRESVKRQVHAAPQATSEFFAVPWTDPLPRPAVALECDPVPEHEIGPLVKQISQREGLTPDLLRAVIEKESSYLPCALSSAGAQGLMQLMPDTASDLGVANPFDPQQNVEGGAHYLKQMLDRYNGNLVLALAAYNAGPGRVEAGGPWPVETTNYVSGVMGKMGLVMPTPVQPVQ